jgi:hypothetical protein
VANYNVDIAVALKGAKELLKLRKDINAVTQEVSGFNKALETNANKFPKTINNLTESVNKARTALKNAAVGTTSFNNAAEVFLRTQKALNKELAEEARILKQIETRRFGVAQSSSGNRVRRNVAESRRSRISSKFKTLDTPTPDKLGQVAIRTNVLRNIRESQESRIGEGFRSLSLSGQSVDVEAKIKQTLENRKRTEKEVAQIRERLIKKEEKLNATRRKILKEEITTRTRILRQNQFGNVNPGAGGFRAFSQRADQITANAAATANRPGIGSLIRSQFAPGGSFAATRGQRFRGAASNALIGGGFPFLFGQGPIGAIGGGLGGAVGGALGGGFGFGLSIAGTALAQQIQQTLDFRKSIRELNKEMQEMGISSNISGSAVRNLGKSLGITKEEAVKALQEFKRFGNQAILFAEKFGGDFAKFDAIAQANTVQSALAAIRKINKDLTLDDELRFINSVRRLGVEATINQMLDEMLEKEKKLKTAGFGQGEGKNAGANRKRLGQLNRERDATQELVDKNKDFIEGLTRVRDQFTQNRDAAEAANRGIRKGLEDVNAELRKLNDVQFQVVELSKTLGSAFSESFKGIIKGTMSVGDAFRNMFMRIADHFLDMAAQMMAAQISKGFMGLFANAFSGGLASSAQLGAQATAMTGIPSGADLPAGSFNISTIKRQYGGGVTAGKSYLVGERGAELFTPGATGTITPNHAMGATNIVVNVDASGSSVEGSEQGGRELGRVISVAIQSELIKQKRPGGLLA